VLHPPFATPFVSLPRDILHFSCTRHSLQFNKLGPKGAAAIAEGLKGNTSLKELKCA